MKRKWLFLSLFLIGSLAISSFWLFNLRKTSKTQAIFRTEKGGYFIPIKIVEFSRGRIPCVKVQIEEKRITAKVDLGFKGILALSSEVLQNIKEKTFEREGSHYNFRGNQFPYKAFTIPQLKMGGLVVSDIPTNEESADFSIDSALITTEKEDVRFREARIGWYMFRKSNLFLDCKHSLLAACDSLETLKKRGYPTKSFVEATLINEHGLLELEASTDKGPLRCLIDTGTTCNVLNLSILEEEWELPLNFDLEKRVHYRLFQIGEKDFGPIDFLPVPIKLPIKIAAVLGMEFISSKLIFFDFANKKVYFAEAPD